MHRCFRGAKCLKSRVAGTSIEESTVFHHWLLSLVVFVHRTDGLICSGAGAGEGEGAYDRESVRSGVKYRWYMPGVNPLSRLFLIRGSRMMERRCMEVNVVLGYDIFSVRV